MAKGDYETCDSRQAEGFLATQLLAKAGKVTLLDSPQPGDPAGTCTVLIVQVVDEPMVRVALTRHEALSLARALLTDIAP